MLLGEAESRDAAHYEHGLGTSTWLADTHRFTRREANRLLHDGDDLTRFTQVREGMLDGGISVPQSQAVACDADLLPAILGGPSGILDVGRDHRLVTPTIRAALAARDQGCVFPGCDQPPAACDAHHLIPWQQGGTTSLVNLVLAGRHHHGIIEPGDRPEHTRWHVRLRDDCVPEVIPPAHVDHARRPCVHQRFRTPDRAG